MANAKKKGLGKGLGALISERTLEQPEKGREHPPQDAALPDGSRLVLVDPTELEPNPKQPRRQFDEEHLEELANSLKRDGLQEPVIVREVNGKHQLVSGERRVRASIMAGLEQIPAIVREVSDRDLLKLGLIENIQREDLNAIEVAHAYQELIEQFGWTQEELSREVGKKRATVTNTLRLLSLPEPVQQQVAEGALSMGHARAVLAFESSKDQLEAARKIVSRGLSVRQAEKLAAEHKEPATPKKKDPNVAQIEDNLRRKLGTKVSLSHRPDGGGKIALEYYSSEELERLLDLLLGR